MICYLKRIDVEVETLICTNKLFFFLLAYWAIELFTYFE